MIEPTDEMLAAFERSWEYAGSESGVIFRRQNRAGLAAVFAIVERDLRASIAADIDAALAAEKADPDVSSGDAIWQQTGYCYGLAAAAEIARDAT